MKKVDFRNTICVLDVILLTSILFALSSCSGKNSNKQTGKTETDAWEREVRELMAKPPVIPKQEQSILTEGELMYKGYATFTQAASFEVSFVLAADKSVIRDLKIAITGLNVTARHQNSEITVNVTNSTTTYTQPSPVRNNKVDASLGKNGNLSIKFDGDASASGSIAYTYVISSSGDRPDIPVNFGSSAIRFRKQ